MESLNKLCMYLTKNINDSIKMVDIFILKPGLNTSLLSPLSRIYIINHDSYIIVHFFRGSVLMSLPLLDDVFKCSKLIIAM